MTKRERRTRRALLERLHVKLPPCVTERAKDYIWDESDPAPVRPSTFELFSAAQARATFEGLIGQLSSDSQQ